jgi:phosphoribosylaminoimidazolecarboxamide formyltransferase/IMP cyclohydrolase
MVKHANACGVAVGATLEEAYEAALASDPQSAFGMVCSVNRPVGGVLARRIAERFVDVLYAPAYDDDALGVLRSKPSTRILVNRERRAFPAGELDFKRVPGGLLVQDRDWDVEERGAMIVVAGSLTEEQWGNVLFAWRVCKHVSSNAIVLAKDLRTIGIGAGQQSRVDSVRIAIEKADRFGHDLVGAVLASDAFFPFADGPELALSRGIAAIVQPGGSKRDPEVVAAVEEAGAAMVFAGRRHFRH